MLTDFFYHLRAHRLPVSVQEYLTLLDALRTSVMPPTLTDFYHLARMTLVKDETLYDRYDQAFDEFYKQLESRFPTEDGAEIPLDWLIKELQKNLTPEEKAAIEKHGWDKLMELFRERLKEQKERHAGGSKWIGTGGTSPFGHGGYHPEGIRVGGESKNRSAAKVWEKREFRNFDDSLSLGNRNIQVALKRLRQFARAGAAEELDLDSTIKATARNAGYLDLKMVREKHNSVKVLLLLDVGGSMDDHIEMVEELFTACRTEFKHLEHYYFHNCLYESVWKDNNRRFNERIPTMDLIHKYGPDYKVIFVGDASMSPYEIAVAGGSVEHFNQEPGQVWLKRVLNNWEKSVWLNPVPEKYWGYTQSIGMIHQLMEKRMYPLTIEGLDAAMKELVK